MPSALRTKPCELCGAESALRYRIRTAPDTPWRLACPPCRERAAGNPGYRYGGTWKAKRSRRADRAP